MFGGWALRLPAACWGLDKAERARLKRTINLVLFAILLSSTYLDYWAYSVAYHKDPNQYPAIAHGVADAPAQYRVGVIDTANFLSLHSHAPLRMLFAAIDLLAALAAAFTLLTLLRRSSTYTRSSIGWRWVGEFGFVGLVEYYLAWLTWYQRPETLTSAALLALSVALLSPSTLTKAPLRPLVVSGGLLLLAAAQSLVRADVIVAFYLGVFCVAMFRAPDESSSLPRGVQLVVSGAGILLGLSVQYILMHVIFPHATYGNTRTVQIYSNLTGVIGYVPFLLFLLPFFWTIWRVFRKKEILTNVEAGVLAASMIFACVWLVLGVIQEVRIFLPYGLVLAPVTASLLMRQARSLSSHGS